MKIIIRFKSGFELPVICEEAKFKYELTELAGYTFKGIKGNKPIYIHMREVECIYRDMKWEEESDT